MKGKRWKGEKNMDKWVATKWMDGWIDISGDRFPIASFYRTFSLRYFLLFLPELGVCTKRKIKRRATVAARIEDLLLLNSGPCI